MKKIEISKEDEKLMMNWTRLIIVWFVLLVVSLFLIKLEIVLGLWLVITGIIMYYKKEDYKKWYIRVYGTE